MFRNAAHDHQIGENFQHIFTAQASHNLDRKAFAGELINDCEHTEPFAIPRSILDEAIGPDMIAMLRSQSYAGAVIKPETTAFGLFHRNFQALAPPSSSDSFVVHMPALIAQHRCDALIAIASKLACQGNNRCRQGVFIIGLFQLAPLR